MIKKIKKDETKGFLILLILFALIFLVVFIMIKSAEKKEQKYECVVNDQIYNCAGCYLKDGIGYCYIDYELIKVDNFYEVK